MPKQISHKIINNSSLKQNQEKNRERELISHPDKQRRDLSEGNSYYNNNTSHNQSVNIIKSSSKKNINMHNNSNNQNNNNPLMIQDNTKNKKVEGAKLACKCSHKIVRGSSV